MDDILRSHMFISPAKREILRLLLEQKKGNAAAVEQTRTQRPLSRLVPLSLAQGRLFFLDQFMPSGSAYAIPLVVRLNGYVNIQVVERSLQEIIQRHEALRTTITIVDERPFQSVALECYLDVPIVDTSALEMPYQSLEIERLILSQAKKSFDLIGGRLLRAVLLRITEEHHLLLLTFHHIIFDGWSVGIFLHEFTTLYEAYSRKLPSPLEKLPMQYADFTLWQQQLQQEAVFQQHLAYWKSQLKGLAPLNLPLDHPRPAMQRFRGATFAFVISPELTTAINTLCTMEKVTPFMCLLAAFYCLLMRYSGQKDIAVGTTIANRLQKAQEHIIGFFANTLVIRIDGSGAPDFLALLKRVREICLDAYAHQDIPFERLVEELVPVRNVSLHPLFQIMFELQNTPLPLKHLGKATLSLVECDYESAKFDMNLQMAPSDLGFQGFLEYNTDIFDKTTIERMARHYQTLLESIVDNPSQPITTLAMLTLQERDQLLRVWNSSDRAHEQGFLHSFFEIQVAKTPDAIAAIFENQVISYQELDERANQLAHHFYKLGVRSGVYVGLCLQKSLEILIGLLGILKAGGAFLPLDPDYPTNRLMYMVHDSHLSLLLCHGATLALCQPLLQEDVHLLVALDNALPSENLPTSVTFSNAEHISLCPSFPLDLALIREAPAYVMYTSGSTGQPKGVPISHANAVPFFDWTQKHFVFHSRDRVIQYHTLSFDFSVWEIFEALDCGACLCLVSSMLARDVDALAQYITAECISVLNMTPSQFDALAGHVSGYLPNALDCVRLLVLGGEAVTVPLAKRARELLHPDCQLFNEYGPTETTISCAIYPITPLSLLHTEGLRSISFGWPITGMQLYVLDAQLKLLPVGVPGYLYISGTGLSDGYLYQPALTADRFIPHPYSSVPGSRLYKTGDIVSRLQDGALEFLGRSDHQVKLRGYRIEMGEIEIVLAGHPAVRECIVVMQGEKSEDQRLVAFVQRVAGSALHRRELREHAQGLLPEYMIPSFIFLDAFPLTPNGKVDREQLQRFQLAEPMPEDGGQLPTARTLLEETVLTIWAEALKLERLSIHDNFFEMGGHSLLTTRIIARLRTVFQIDIPLRIIFEYPTVAAFSKELHTLLSMRQDLVRPPLVKTVDRKSVPLSFAQQRMWLIHHMYPASSHYHIALAFRMIGPLDSNALRNAIFEVVERHESLRTFFLLEGDEPRQQSCSVAEFSNRLFEYQSLSSIPASVRQHEADRLIKRVGETPFELEKAPLLRFVLLEMQEQEHIFYFVTHHIVMDEWSLEMLLKEISLVYEAFLSSRTSPLPPLPIQYADYALWQRQWLQMSVLEKEFSHWQQRLKGAPLSIELPVARPRPVMQTFRGASYSFHGSPALTRQLKMLSQQQGATLFMILLAAFEVLLFFYSGQEDMLVGTPMANRFLPETEELIGFFVNTVVLRAKLSGNPSFSHLLQQVREDALDAYTHQELPFEYLVQSLQTERALDRAPLVQVMFSFQHAPLSPLKLAQLTTHFLELEHTTAKFDLLLFMEEGENGLTGSFEYSTDLFDERQMYSMSQQYLALLEAIVHNPEQKLSTLSMVSPSEFQRMVYEWNATQASYPEDACLHTLFENQLEHGADRIALVFGEEHITYQVVDQHANQVAHYLHMYGIGADSVVGLCTERSIAMIVGLLGILKAGGAYLPCDPAYPQKRLALMLDDAGVSLVLTQQHLAALFTSPSLQKVYLDADWPLIAQASSERRAFTVQPGNLAYVIYTSGSTGKPKGTLVAHRGICNLAAAQARIFGVETNDRILQFASLGFDASIWEITKAFYAGATLCLAEQQVLLPGPALKNLLQEQSVTIATFPPSILAALPPASFPALHTVITAGEACSSDLVKQWGATHTFFNAYGLTETSVCATVALCHESSQPPSIGRPISNVQTYVLDSHLRPVPVGVPGELYIGGICLAHGYLHHPELTAERFLPSPFHSETGMRIYKTGDRVRARADGSLEFLGRFDHQIKIRGFRIEIDEIEMILNEHPMIQQSCIKSYTDSAGELSLAAFIIPSSGQEAPHLGLIRQFLRERLPQHMIPSVFFIQKTLPLTANGKVDRSALQVPVSAIAGFRPEAYVTPRTEIERTITEIWQEVLGRRHISMYDNFFELGGHSLRAVQVHSKLSAFFGDLSIVDMFAYPTIAALAEHISRGERHELSSEETVSPSINRLARMQQQRIRRQKSF